MAYPVPASDPTAVVGRRIVAYGIDLLILLAITMAVFIPAFDSAAKSYDAREYRCPDVAGIESPSPFDDLDRTVVGQEGDPCIEWDDTIRLLPEEDAGPVSIKLYGTLALVGVLNLVLLQGTTGASIGKHATGLRVITEQGAIAGLGAALLRWVLLFVDAMCCFLPGAVLVFTTKGHRRLGDMAARTFVVAKRDVGPVPQVPGVTGPGYGPAVPYARDDYGTDGSHWSPPLPPPGTWGPPPGAGGHLPGPGGGDGSGSPAGDRPEGHRDDGPFWDDDRDTYIQYDRAVEAWVQWDSSINSWKPIEQ